MRTHLPIKGKQMGGWREGSVILQDSSGNIKLRNSVWMEVTDCYVYGLNYNSSTEFKAIFSQMEQKVTVHLYHFWEEIFAHNKCKCANAELTISVAHFHFILVITSCLGNKQAFWKVIWNLCSIFPMGQN